jgi:hypothetical protein
MKFLGIFVRTYFLRANGPFFVCSHWLFQWFITIFCEASESSKFTSTPNKSLDFTFCVNFSLHLKFHTDDPISVWICFSEGMSIQSHKKLGIVVFLSKKLLTVGRFLDSSSISKSRHVIALDIFTHPWKFQWSHIYGLLPRSHGISNDNPLANLSQRNRIRTIAVPVNRPGNAFMCYHLVLNIITKQYANVVIFEWAEWWFLNKGGLVVRLKTFIPSSFSQYLQLRSNGWISSLNCDCSFILTRVLRNIDCCVRDLEITQFSLWFVIDVNDQPTLTQNRSNR